MDTYIGFDSAWTDKKNAPGAICALSFEGGRPDMDIAALFQRSQPDLSAEEAAAYAAPFPDARYKAVCGVSPNW